ncbi:MAG TPA: diguanylate cyclase [Steroidobacteraceae bacterium]|nr:diguanylate cyclase [Steroidobacteraceae bacterium]
MNAAMLRDTLQQLQRATHDHREWHEQFLRTLVCGLPGREDDLASDAHQRCRFGHWYYVDAPAELRELPAFAEMEAQHALLHRIAASMTRRQAEGQSIPADEYQQYVTAEEALRRELGSLRHEIQDILRSTDPLTGAFGRARLLPELRAWRELAARDVEPCCIAFMDVDHLKTINDVHGHTVGDRVLQGLVSYLAQHLRRYDKVFRYGGDEFLLPLPATDLQQAEHLVERIRAGIAEVPFVVSADGRPIHATASFGIAALDPDISVDESIDRADRALLQAKTSGRNRVVSWDPGIATGTILAWRREGTPEPGA